MRTFISENSYLGQEAASQAPPAPVPAPESKPAVASQVDIGACLMCVLIQATVGAFAVGFIAQIAKGLGSQVAPYHLKTR